MRELKFRVWDTWDKNEGKMYYLDLNDWESQAEFVEIDFTSEPIFMQYTGLKDKNGKEIYEGYVIKTSKAEVYGIVEYRGCSFVVHHYNPEFNQEIIPEASNIYYEVIGNIYENPELLKNT